MTDVGDLRDAGDPGEVVVWLRVDQPHDRSLEAPVLGMWLRGDGTPQPLEAPADGLVQSFTGYGQANGSFIVDPEDPSPPQRFQARGTVSVTVAGGALYAICLPEGGNDLGFWLVEAAGDVASASAGPAARLQGLGWTVELPEVSEVDERGLGAASPAAAEALVAALSPAPVPGRPGGVRSEPVTGPTPVVPGAHDDELIELRHESRVGRAVGVVVVLALVVGALGLGGMWGLDRLRGLLDGGEKASTSTTVPVPTTAITLPEGRRLNQILAKISEEESRLTVADLEAALADGEVSSSLKPDDQPSYEGLLFPATYDVAETSTAVDVLDELADEMVSRVEALDPEAGRARIKERYGLELTTYELVTVASIVQAEAGSPEEMAKVATVIYNRLVDDSGEFPYLYIDAIDRYGAEQTGMELGQYWETTEPYNSRGVAGLPPTPVGSPGDAALDAAMNPAEGDWLWYVLADPGVHTFLHTQAEFDAAKLVCQQKDLC